MGGGGGAWGGGGNEKLSSANILLKYICLSKHFFPTSSSCKHFFSIFFSVFFLFLLNITIAFYTILIIV